MRSSCLLTFICHAALASFRLALLAPHARAYLQTTDPVSQAAIRSATHPACEPAACRSDLQTSSVLPASQRPTQTLIIATEPNTRSLSHYPALTIRPISHTLNQARLSRDLASSPHLSRLILTISSLTSHSSSTHRCLSNASHLRAVVAAAPTSSALAFVPRTRGTDDDLAPTDA